MSTPKPGKSVKGSTTGRPIMVLLDLWGRRWALRIIWELVQSGPSSFRTLQKLCGNIFPTVLNTRLAELREDDIVELHKGQGYGLTMEGKELVSSLSDLDTWSKRWAQREKKKSRIRIKYKIS